MAGASSPYYLLKEEFIQRADEGCDIPNDLREAFASLDSKEDEWNLERIDPIYDALMELPNDPELRAREPDDLEAIRALRPDGPRDLGWEPSDEELLDKLHGAWTGRCVGCALGKPVESMGMRRDDRGNLRGRRDIKKYLQNRDDWPLSDYVSCRDVGDGMSVNGEASCREHIAFMEPDDDIHYSLMGLGVMEEHGLNFTWNDAALYVLSHIPISTIWTAEMQSLLNLQNVSRKGHDPVRGPEWISTYRNPYREWIGAQIRADGFAFCCAGRPEMAAETVYKDACWTHRRNGIYGAMMWAAIQAAAFVERDVDRLVEIGLSEIPAECRLARWIRKTRDGCLKVPDFESCMDRLEQELGEMHAVHVINNAMICVIAMYFGKLDTTQTPAIATMCGLDTDCNAATVGSVVGAAAGRGNFGGTLADRLNDTVKPSMIGFPEITMGALAERTAEVWQNINA